MKELTLRQLRDLISDIYVQKAKYDRKCMENKQSKETMEQYLYTYLNQLYGIKGLVQDWANTIFDAIKKYSSDSDVTLFSMIMRNDLAESFATEARDLKNSMRETLRDSLRRSLKYKDESEAFAYINSACAGQLPVDESVWKDVISRTFVSETDRRSLEQRAKDLLRRKSGSKSATALPQGDSRPTLKEERKSNALTLPELQSMALGMEISHYNLQCGKFAAAFRRRDSDANGLINAEEFRGLIADMGAAVDTEALRKVLDPFSTQQIGFSECFKALSLVRVEAEIGGTRREMSAIDAFNRVAP